MKKIALCGSVILDEVKRIDKYPDKGMLVTILSMSRAVGGAVCNSGVDLKVLDGDLAVEAIGRVGNDDKGRFVVDYLASRGILTDKITVSDTAPTAFTDVMTIDSTGERTFFNMRGACSELTADSVDVDALDCDIFHLGYLLLLDGLDRENSEFGTEAARLLSRVQAKGIKTSIDVVSEQSDRFERLVRPALKYCDYVVINEIEGGRVAGISPHSESGKLSLSHLKEICRRMMDMGVREAVTVHCPKLSCSLDKNGEFTVLPSVALPRDAIVGTVGAGDAFCAGMLYGFVMGKSAAESMRIASAAAVCNLTVSDSVSGARSLAETMALEARLGREILTDVEE